MSKVVGIVVLFAPSHLRGGSSPGSYVPQYSKNQSCFKNLEKCEYRNQRIVVRLHIMSSSLVVRKSQYSRRSTRVLFTIIFSSQSKA